MPQYEVIDLNGIWCWIRQFNGSYLVDVKWEQEFLEKCKAGAII